MSDVSSILSLPYIQPNQAQKHVTHNEGMRILDVVTQLSVRSATLTQPPASVQDGDRFIVGASATDVWAGKDGQVAVLDMSAWSFFVPSSGWVAWIEDTSVLHAYDGSNWIPAGGNLPESLPQLGISTSADATNKLAVSSDATLLTHNGSGHQLKMNKATSGDTASLLFQTGWSGRAEMGTAGTDDFEIKVSPDGSSFFQAMLVSAADGQVRFPSGATEFGSAGLINLDYAAAKGGDLVANGNLGLGQRYNYPTGATFDSTTSPNLAGSVSFAGHSGGLEEMSEFLTVDPNRAYQLTSYLCQEALSGDWSAHANQERHMQQMGVVCYDADQQAIEARHHMRFRHGGQDSMTVLAAPLTPGDTTITVADANGWNEADSADFSRGVIVFGYRSATGQSHSHYSRYVEFDLFDLGGVNKGSGVVTLNKPFPASLANPDDAGGTWPAGTAIANSSDGTRNKRAFYNDLVPAEAGKWYQTTSHIGGLDLSGTNAIDNFAPGTAWIRPFWLPNHSNRVGGFDGFPDTGTGHRVWVSGVSVIPEPTSFLDRIATGPSSGRVSVHVPAADAGTGQVTLVVASPKVSEV